MSTIFKRETGSTFSYTGTSSLGETKAESDKPLVMTTTHPLKPPSRFRHTESLRLTKTHRRAAMLDEPRALSANRERRPLVEASGLRVAFTKTSISFPCGFHSRTTTTNTTRTHDILTQKCVSYLNIIVFTVFRYPRKILVAFHERSFTGRDFLL